jgi:hypothetical protein
MNNRETSRIDDYEKKGFKSFVGFNRVKDDEGSDGGSSIYSKSGSIAA